MIAEVDMTVTEQHENQEQGEWAKSGTNKHPYRPPQTLDRTSRK